MLTKKFMTSLLRIAILVVLAALSPQIARSQPRCGEYSLDYIVRDERGRVIDANSEGLWIGAGWNTSVGEFGPYYGIPPAVSNLVAKQNYLSYIKGGEPCRFREPIKLQLTFGGKNMTLIFQAKGLANIVVDSLPFQQGTFEHQLSARVPGSRFYSAEGWKKIGDEAEAVARYPIAYVRGRVVDSATGRPVPHALVSLTTNGYNSLVAGYASPKGLYELKVRADHFEKVSGLAVIATDPDYLEDFAIAVENRKSGPLETVNNVNVKMVRVVNISGRVINEKTGTAPSPKDGVSFKAEYPGSKELWGTKIGGQTEYFSVKPDGTFTIKTGVGKNRLDLGAYGGCYELKDDQKELDLGPQGRSGLVLALTTPRGCRVHAVVSPKVLDQYVGQYQLPPTAYSQAYVVKVFREGEDLYGEFDGEKTELVPWSETLFGTNTVGSDVLFVRDAAGKVTHFERSGTIAKKIN